MWARLFCTVAILLFHLLSTGVALQVKATIFGLVLVLIHVCGKAVCVWGGEIFREEAGLGVGVRCVREFTLPQCNFPWARVFVLLC